jgi:hypothetical protein
MSRPAISASICSPELGGLAPSTTWRNSGRYVTEPNRANPTTKPMALVMENTELRNSQGGRTGSAARRSTSTKATSRTTVRTPRPMICGDPQP